MLETMPAVHAGTQNHNLPLNQDAGAGYRGAGSFAQPTSRRLLLGYFARFTIRLSSKHIVLRCPGQPL